MSHFESLPRDAELVAQLRIKTLETVVKWIGAHIGKLPKEVIIDMCKSALGEKLDQP